jgi:hypothetical protein
MKGHIKFGQQKGRNKQNEKEKPFDFIKTLVGEKRNATL